MIWYVYLKNNYSLPSKQQQQQKKKKKAHPTVWCHSAELVNGNFGILLHLVHSTQLPNGKVLHCKRKSDPIQEMLEKKKNRTAVMSEQTWLISLPPPITNMPPSWSKLWVEAASGTSHNQANPQIPWHKPCYGHNVVMGSREGSARRKSLDQGRRRVTCWSTLLGSLLQRAKPKTKK